MFTESNKNSSEYSDSLYIKNNKRKVIRRNKHGFYSTVVMYETIAGHKHMDRAMDLTNELYA